MSLTTFLLAFVATYAASFVVYFLLQIEADVRGFASERRWEEERRNPPPEPLLSPDRWHADDDLDAVMRDIAARAAEAAR